MVYKESKYNVFGELGGKSILANTFTGAVVTLDSKGKEAAAYLLQNPSRIGKFVNTHLGSILVENGFLTPHDVSELEILQETHRIAKTGEDSLGPAITTTMQCNFRCTYCYEYEKLESTHLTHSPELSIISLLEKKLSEKQLLHVVWWGGEPLLRAKTIGTLTKRMLECCKKNSVRYLASITTNGSLPHEKNSRLLRRHHV